jgi:hypothetical protein
LQRPHPEPIAPRQLMLCQSAQLRFSHVLPASGAPVLAAAAVSIPAQAIVHAKLASDDVASTQRIRHAPHGAVAGVATSRCKAATWLVAVASAVSCSTVQGEAPVTGTRGTVGGYDGAPVGSCDGNGAPVGESEGMHRPQLLGQKAPRELFSPAVLQKGAAWLQLSKGTLPVLCANSKSSLSLSSHWPTYTGSTVGTGVRGFSSIVGPNVRIEP